MECILDATVNIASENGRFEDTFDYEEEGKELGYRSWRGVRMIWNLGMLGWVLGTRMVCGADRDEWEEEEGMDVDEYGDSDSD